MTSTIEDHADKYNDPRVKLSRRGILFGVAVVLFGIGGTALSIWARRTKLEKTTEFWGVPTITAFQLAEEVELVIPPDENNADVQTVRLSGMPGLGHLRHVFLDERSYNWESVVEEPVGSQPEKAEHYTLHFTDPSAERFPDVWIDIDLENGWVGAKDGDQRVKFNERFRDAMPTFLKRIANYEPLRAENRAQKAAEEAAAESAE